MDHIKFIYLFAALNILDAVLTVLILRKFGVEKNPIVRWFIRQFGEVPGLVIVKVLLIALMYSLGPLSFYAQLILLAGYVILDISNARVLWRLTK